MTERQILQSGPRPRYGRLVAASSALAITLVTLLGGLGLLPDGSSAAASSGNEGAQESASLTGATVPDALRSVSPKGTPTPAAEPAPSSTGSPSAGAALPAVALPAAALPSGSGTGRRVVFDMSDQRVWLVDPGNVEDDEVLSSYLVSGSLTNNLSPGTYEVYSHSRRAVGIDDSGVMQYFVRFTRGDNAAIGFHSIPTKDGRALQSEAQLGSPQSHGCIRQALTDARRLWSFAPVGTKVVVTA